MKNHKIALFAGTTEGRKLSELLAASGITHTICVATAYGEMILNTHPLVHVRQGRMNRNEISAFVAKEQITLVIDATHPFAEEVTQNIKGAVKEQHDKGMHVDYLRLKRDEMDQQEDFVTCFNTNEDCSEALKTTQGNILLTTGSKDLFQYCKNEEIRNRLYVRVLPSMESLMICMEQGICREQIIAMQGPFTTELNEALIRQYQISYVVTKESGALGGCPEKLKAAKRTGAKVFVIGRPKEEGLSFDMICSKLEKLCGKTLRCQKPLELILAGIGMGNENGLTKEAEQAIHEADMILGSKRILEKFPQQKEKQPFYQAEQIIPYLYKLQETNQFIRSFKIAILFSGDSGFYSGCRFLYAALEEEIRSGKLQASLRILPGISSVAYLAAATKESYQDAAVYSIHEKEMCNLANRIKRHSKTFLLTSGVRDINRMGKLLLDADMPECEVITGYQLSYPEERIEHHTPLECMDLKEEGLYTCLIKNPYAIKRKLTHGIADGQFIRQRIPMTKEEVREISICKLHLRENDILYDIGSGTGSMAIEIAGLSDNIQVYAVEQKEDAVSLITQNKERFGLQNITIIKAIAPEGLSSLPTPTQAFIGGSGGRLKEILSVLWQKNPQMRIVINAVSIETICEIKELLSLYPVKDEEIVQVQISRMQKAGSHHLMQAENPVWICSFHFDGAPE